jgi:hypothetical protein
LFSYRCLLGLPMRNTNITHTFINNICFLESKFNSNHCQLYIWQGINNQNTQEVQKAKLPKTQWPNEEMGTWTEQSFFKEVQMTKKHMKICSPSLAIKEMQIKAMTKILLHSCEEGYHQEHKQQQILLRMWGKMNTSTLLVGI